VCCILNLKSSIVWYSLFQKEKGYLRWLILTVNLIGKLKGHISGCVCERFPETVGSRGFSPNQWCNPLIHSHLSRLVGGGGMWKVVPPVKGQPWPWALPVSSVFQLLGGEQHTATRCSVSPQAHSDEAKGSCAKTNPFSLNCLSWCSSDPPASQPPCGKWCALGQALVPHSRAPL
jgi:hypothetical protein